MASSKPRSRPSAGAASRPGSLSPAPRPRSRRSRSGWTPYDPAKTHGYVLSARERDAIFDRLASMNLAQRAAVPGLQPSRAGVIIPGIVILAELMELFGLSTIEVSEHDILYGAAAGGVRTSA